MIVRPVRDVVQLIHQHDHARAAGTLARRWKGTPVVPAPPARVEDSLFFAADNHDVGWCRLDSAPRFDMQTGLPQSFFDATVEEAVSVWTEGICFCEVHSPFSGFLVSVHFSSLAETGISGAPAADLALLRRFVEGERRRQEDLLKGSGPEESAFREEAARLLRVCDTLSLIACRAPEISPEPGGSLSLARGGLKVRLSGEEGGEEKMALSPWPFTSEDVQLLFPGFTIPRDGFDSQVELDEAIRGAEPAIFETRLVPLAG